MFPFSKWSEFCSLHYKVERIYVSKWSEFMFTALQIWQPNNELANFISAMANYGLFAQTEGTWYKRGKGEREQAESFDHIVKPWFLHDT